jgi:hypothetical protein
MIRPYAAFNVLPTEVAESGRSRTKLLPAANAIADCLVLSVIANATVVWLEGERRTRSKIVLLCSPNLRSTTTVSNFRVFTRRMALGTSVHTSVVAANSRSGSEICLIVNGSSEASSARTGDSAEPRVTVVTLSRACACVDYCFFACRLAEFFAAVLKTEQGGGWLLIGIALRRGHRVPNHNQAERIPVRSILEMASGRQADDGIA